MSGVSLPLVLVSEFPSTMIPLKSRIEDSGYAFFDISAVPGGMAPKIALIPFNVQVNLATLQARIKAVRAANPEITIIGVNLGRMQFKINDAYGAGIQLLFSLPFEEELLINKLFELLPPSNEGKDLTPDMLMRVNVLEVEREPALPFDLYLYLPANRKVILYYNKGSAIDEKRVKKFKENAHYSLYLRRTDLQTYKKYCAAVVARGGARGEVISEGERRKRSAERLMGLMGAFFTDESLGEEEAAMAIDNLKGVVDTMETPGTSKELVAEVVKLSSQQMTQASHAQNVAAYCCLFGLALNVSDPTTLKLGGLLHDIGRADFPLHLVGLELSEMDPVDAAMYKLHPGHGKMAIKNNKLKVSNDVVDMILYHHERPDGSGYPYGKTSADIPVVAKICAFADEFDKLTSVRPNKRQLSPIEAVRRIAGLDGGAPMTVYEEAFHKPIVDMMLKPKAEALKAEAAASLGKVQVAEAKIPKPVGGGLTVQSLLENPKFAVKRTAHLAKDVPEYAGVWQELEDHWVKRKLRAARST